MVWCLQCAKIREQIELFGVKKSARHKAVTMVAKSRISRALGSNTPLSECYYLNAG